MIKRLLLILLVTTTACSLNKFDDQPELPYSAMWIPNATIAEINPLAGTGTIQEDIIIEGAITSSDSAGSIYKQLFIQDKSHACALQIGLFDLYERYPIGSIVNINLKGAACAIVNNTLQIGYASTPNTENKYSVETINAPALVALHLQKTIEKAPITPQETTIPQLSPTLAGKLLKIKGSFPKATQNTFAGEQILQDTEGNKVILYTSPYASFAKDTLPKGSITITAILSYYKDKPQLLINSTKDIKVAR